MSQRFAIILLSVSLYSTGAFPDCKTTSTTGDRKVFCTGEKITCAKECDKLKITYMDSFQKALLYGPLGGDAEKVILNQLVKKSNDDIVRNCLKAVWAQQGTSACYNYDSRRTVENNARSLIQKLNELYPPKVSPLGQPGDSKAAQ
jgi:hypothetical protein